MAPYFDDGQNQIYQVQVPVVLPMRRPTDRGGRRARQDGAVPAASRSSRPTTSRPRFASPSATSTTRSTSSSCSSIRGTSSCATGRASRSCRTSPRSPTSAATTSASSSRPSPASRAPSPATTRASWPSISPRSWQINAKPPADPVANVNGLFNHVFNLQNRSTEPSPLIAGYIPKVVSGDARLRPRAPLGPSR